MRFSNSWYFQSSSISVRFSSNVFFPCTHNCSFVNLTRVSIVLLAGGFSKSSYGPRQANLVLTAYASSEGSGKPARIQNLRCSLIQAVGQEVPSDRKPDP